MDAFLDGDAKAFEQLYKRLSPRLHAALSQMSGDARLAEDLTQVVFLKIYRARGAFQRGMLVSPWMFAIGRNVFLDHLRSVRRRPESLSVDGALPEREAGCEGPEPELAGLQELLQGLPENQRQALLLLKVQQLSIDEAALLCGTSPASIKMRAHRAYQAMRSRLGGSVKP